MLNKIQEKYVLTLRFDVSVINYLCNNGFMSATNDYHDSWGIWRIQELAKNSRGRYVPICMHIQEPFYMGHSPRITPFYSCEGQM
jgi:hypothetical protein